LKKINFILIPLLFATLNLGSQTPDYANRVNPFIGTGGTGHTFPGAVLPFGMVQLSPDTRIDGSWEGCSGYYHADSVIYGFSHTHLSGTGVSDYGDILLMPTTGEASLKNKDYSSHFTHLKEKATPGFYQVHLDDDQITAELTATTRVGIHRYTFPKTDKANVIIDLLHRDKTIRSNITIIDSVTIIGYRVSEAWAREQHVYFALKFSKPFKKSGLSTMQEGAKFPQTKKTEKTEGGFFQFDIRDDQPLLIKVAISQTSADGAMKNLYAEAPHWDFEKYKTDAKQAWNNELSKIEVSDENPEKSTLFYTALYHCMIHPSVACDVDGKYRGRDFKIHEANGFVPYTVFSLWDTFRALHPLFSIIQQKRTTDIVNTFLHQYQEGNRLPMWELSANETNCMIGFHSVSVITDAYTKNIGGFDAELAYKAMMDASNYQDLGTPVFNKNLYLQIDDESESVSKTLEYAYDNWCIAQMARKLNKTKDYAFLMKRAQGYKNLYDAQTGFIRPRKNGGWLNPFDPTEVNNYYTEANGWQYTFFVPQDLDGLMLRMGGAKRMEQKLDELFTTSSKTSGREQVDITGLIGQYAHGNEPSHHMAYLYDYVGKPNKTQERVYQILNEFYRNDPDGLIGNEDCGQMSAWYVMSAMGIYQVCPGQPDYAIGTPAFNKVTIRLENGKNFDILKQGKTESSKYIQSFKLNNKPTNHSFISHASIINGGKMEFMMSDKADSTNAFGKAMNDRPHTGIASSLVMAPVISNSAKNRNETSVIFIHTNSAKDKIVYTLNGNEPTKRSAVYTHTFVCDSTVVIKAKAYSGNDSSSTAISYVYKKPNNWKVSLQGKYNRQYDAGGDDGIIDGQHGTTNWKSGGWQGYQGQDFESVIDLGKPTQIQSITSSFLQDTRSWILFPKKVEYFISEDGKNYILFGIIENGVAAEDYSVQIRSFSSTLPTKVSTRYIKVKAFNYGKLPQWHQGNGGEAFIFIDEIELK
jgi:predicted alpha-1,2-mannosidase